MPKAVISNRVTQSTFRVQPIPGSLSWSEPFSGGCQRSRYRAPVKAVDRSDANRTIFASSRMTKKIGKRRSRLLAETRFPEKDTNTFAG
jgi:hypothetical protein